MEAKQMLKNKKVVSAIVAVLLGFGVGIILAMVLGIKTENGFTTYLPQDILGPMLKALTGFDITGAEGFSLRYFGEFVVAALPLILTGLSVAFAFKTGLFNIGAEGQMMVGGIFAVLAGLYLDLPPIIHPIVCILAAGLGGFLFGTIPGYLKARFNVHEVVTCIMMNYIGLYLANMIYRAQPGFASEKTPPLRETALLKSDFLSAITDGSRLNWSILVVFIAVVLFWFVINRTTFGYQLKAIGNNKDAALYAGMNVNRGIVLSMGISGMFSGLAGAVLVLGLFGYGRTLNDFENYGYNGIAVALVGANNALGIVFAGGLFGLLSVAQQILQASGIPRDIAVVISALIILFCAIPLLYDRYVDRFLAWRERRRKPKENKQESERIGDVK